MAKGYWIVTLDVSDDAQYAKYAAVVRPFLAEFCARNLTRGGAHEIVESAGHARNVIVELDNY